MPKTHRGVVALAAVFLLLGGHSALAGDPAAGQVVFKAQCAACHSVTPGKNLTGPSLAGIIGRKTGTIEGFRYSAANKAATLTWDEAHLDPYLKSPKTVIPGTTMTYAGLKDDTKRADLIGYLSTLH